jgi:hypothetical protein
LFHGIDLARLLFTPLERMHRAFKQSCGNR